MTGVPSDIARITMSIVIYLSMPLKIFPAIVMLESALIEGLEDRVCACSWDSPRSIATLPFVSPRLVTPNRSAHDLLSVPGSPPAIRSPPAVAFTSETECQKPGPPTAQQVQEGVAALSNWRRPSRDVRGPFPFVTEPRQIMVRLLLVSLPVCIAATGINFAVLLEFVGSFCLGTVAFALPPVMHLRLYWNVVDTSESLFGHRCKRAFHVILAVLGISVTLCSSAQVIAQQLSGK
eukprot:gnl/MRDRNA2_/MRDRNA2_291276_c0_seq1.p1 gnl/MRDRNA2_/MRDRNA2_291276_c0~~gnl/MRDRNA2_/MRDRNA2_291276_c0_seq1.p1  ORF type:complete len:252 (-),score=21.17 gnl/MRDRNA2_/MRDRNA2_291276_c0_seq1:130-834(-)